MAEAVATSWKELEGRKLRRTTRAENLSGEQKIAPTLTSKNLTKKKNKET